MPNYDGRVMQNYGSHLMPGYDSHLMTIHDSRMMPSYKSCGSTGTHGEWIFDWSVLDEIIYYSPTTHWFVFFIYRYIELQYWRIFVRHGQSTKWKLVSYWLKIIYLTQPIWRSLYDAAYLMQPIWRSLPDAAYLAQFFWRRDVFIKYNFIDGASFLLNHM